MENSKKSITQKIVSFFKYWHLSPQGSRRKQCAYYLPEVQTLLKDYSERISDIFDELNDKLPDGITAHVTPFRPPYNVLGGLSKNVNLGIVTNGSIVPQEFQAEVKQEAARLIFLSKDNLHNQILPEHRIPHQDGRFLTKSNRS